MSNNHSKDNLDRLILLCESKGVKLTKKRQIIAKVICDSVDHPLAEEVWLRARKIDSSISQATVYRALNLFEKKAMLNRHLFQGKSARFEIVFNDHHDHLIDVDTKEVIEFKNEQIEELQELVAEKLGYKLIGHTLELRGKKITKKANNKL